VSQIIRLNTPIPGGTYIQTLTGNSGGAVSPTAGGNINVIGTSPISVTGNPATNTLTVALTNPLPIANGGTNATAMADTFGVNYFDGTRIVTTNVGAATFVLTSNGAGLAPTFQAASGGGGASTALSCGFLAVQQTSVAAVTGDGTVYSLGESQVLTTIFDIGGDVYVGSGAGAAATFTAPMTAYYYLEIAVQLNNLQTGTFSDSIGTYSIVTPAKTYTYEFSPLGLFNANAMVSATGSISQGTFVQLNAGDAVSFNCMSNLNGGGGTKNIGVGGAVTPAQTFISGFIVAGASSPVSWSVITANQTAAINRGYITNKAGTLALLLPAIAAVGSIVRVTGINTATGTQITQAAGQQIFFGTSSTTLGVGGSLTSTNIRDSLEMVCVVANTTFNVISSVGNWTVV